MPVHRLGRSVTLLGCAPSSTTRGRLEFRSKVALRRTGNVVALRRAPRRIRLVDKIEGAEATATPTADPPCLAKALVSVAEMRPAGELAAPVFGPGAAVKAEWILGRGETY
jgi:hypothetical protein